MNIDIQEVEDFIRTAFEENFELLRLEGGHSLAADVKDTALQQVLLYWRKMREVAEHVTDTEVQLNLPQQETPKGRTFSIEGVVDIVREEDRTVMYDIKTHDVDYIHTHTEIYERQLNVYAHIWQNLRGEQPLDQTAVIATAYPETVKEALASGDETALVRALVNWNPLVVLPFNPDQVEETIMDFGCVVDAIEDSDFAPPPLEKLQSRYEGTRTLFATRVCRNCDARFSCSAYRQYALQSRATTSRQMQRYFSDLGNDLDQAEWLSGALDTAPDADNLE